MPRLIDRLLEYLPRQERPSRSGFGVEFIGEIAIIRIPEGQDKVGTALAEKLMNDVKRIRSVYLQPTGISGEFRTRDLVFAAGTDDPETVHTEYGCRYKLNVKKVYFSPRLSTERMRVASQVLPGETVVNMFGGVGPFSILIAKKQKDSTVYSIDSNPAAIEYALQNVRLNKVEGRVFPILGSAEVIVENRFRGVADRALLPLPERSLDYLALAHSSLKEGRGTIHVYTHIYGQTDEEVLDEARERTKGRAPFGFTLGSRRIVKEVGPRWYQVVLDLMIP